MTQNNMDVVKDGWRRGKTSPGAAVEASSLIMTITIAVQERNLIKETKTVVEVKWIFVLSQINNGAP